MNRRLLPIILIALATLLYFHTLNYPFFFDDSHMIVSNDRIHHLSNWLQVWTSNEIASSLNTHWGYRPLNTFIQMLCWVLGGGSTWPFHLVKFVLMGVSGVLVARIAGFWWGQGRKVDQKLVWGVALLWIAHPALTQSAIYISATSTLLCGVFFLAAYLGYLRFRAGEGRGHLLASGLWLVLSLLCKEESVTLLAVIVLTEWMGIGVPPLKISRQSLRDLRILVWPLAFYAVTTLGTLGFLKAMRSVAAHEFAHGNHDAWTYFVTQIRAWPHYLKLWIWPWDLNADNLEFGFTSSILDAQVLEAATLQLVLLVLAWSYRKQEPLFLFGLLWFYITVAPASSFVPLAEPVNDHRFFIPFAGLTLAFAPSAWKWMERLPRPAPRVLLAILVLGFVGGQQVRSRVWKTQETLWGDTLNRNPTSGRAMNNLALVYMERAEWAKASELLDRCVKTWPTYGVCYLNGGLVAAALGNDVLAESQFKLVLGLDPNSSNAMFHFVEFLQSRGRLREAAVLSDKWIKLTGGKSLQAWRAAKRVFELQGDVGSIERTTQQIRVLEGF